MHSNPYLKALRALWIVALIVSSISYLIGLGQSSGSSLTSGAGNGAFLFANVLSCVAVTLFVAWIIVAASRWTPSVGQQATDPVSDSTAEAAPAAAATAVPPQGLEP